MNCASNSGNSFRSTKEHAGRDAAGDHGSNIGARGFVDIETPAVGRKRLQFQQQTGKEEDQRGDADGAGNGGTVRDQVIDVEEAGDGREQRRADQEEA